MYPAWRINSTYRLTSYGGTDVGYNMSFHSIVERIYMIEASSVDSVVPEYLLNLKHMISLISCNYRPIDKMADSVIR
jgi:hypothetical protein